MCRIHTVCYPIEKNTNSTHVISNGGVAIGRLQKGKTLLRGAFVLEKVLTHGLPA